MVVTEIWEGEVYSLPEEGGGKWCSGDGDLGG